MKNENQNLPQTLNKIREIAASSFSDLKVSSVNVSAAFGDVVVFRDNTIKLLKDCPELN